MKAHEMTDYYIMLARTKAHIRGASPAQVQNSVMALNVKCAICNEPTANCGSLTGLTHKWGPVGHDFIPIAY